MDAHASAVTCTTSAQNKGLLEFIVVWGKKAVEGSRFIVLGKKDKDYLSYFYPDASWRLVGSYLAEDASEYAFVTERIETDIRAWLNEQGIAA